MTTEYTIDDLESRLEIEEDDLDSALIEQPTLYWHIGDLLARLQSRRDATKQEIELAEAEAAADIKEEWERNDVKHTQQQLNQAVLRRDTVQELKTKLRKQVLSVARADRLEKAFADRSRMLTNLVRIRTTEGYQSTSRSGAQDAKRRKIGRDYKRRS